MLFLERLKDKNKKKGLKLKVLTVAGVFLVSLVLGSVVSSFFIRNVKSLECLVEGERTTFLLKEEELIVGGKVFKCNNVKGERLCGPVVESENALIFLYISPDLSRIYFAPKLKKEGGREKCHSLGLAYNPTYDVCLSLSNEARCDAR